MRILRALVGAANFVQGKMLPGESDSTFNDVSLALSFLMSNYLLT